MVKVALRLSFGIPGAFWAPVNLDNHFCFLGWSQSNSYPPVAKLC